MRVEVNEGPEGGRAVFDRPLRLIRADHPEEVALALEALDEGLGQGLWTAGLAGYELGYALEPRLARLMPRARRMPLLLFGLYEGWAPAPPLPALRAGTGLRPLRPAWDAARHAQAVARIRRYIEAGDIYQANLTLPFTAEARGTPDQLWAWLEARQPAPQGARLDVAGLPAVLSRSPELFFRASGGAIETWPMKGTQPRGADAAEDALLRRHLAEDPKMRAENLMIVDLLRNDLSRICQPGTVRVPRLFEVQSFATVHQMVSRITGRLAPGTGLGAVLRALFPCGSITGAPKLRAMEIIAELESSPREAYCGSLGWAAPTEAGGGLRAAFNVAIRTLLVEEGRAVLNAGGGIVWDSRAEEEWQEVLWKTRFAEGPGGPAKGGIEPPMAGPPAGGGPVL
ncbi:aminodeoxychorismate synthase component I [Pseudoroseicyclus aestuarii]|uniref:Aminodeoxychorismate synthase subunit I n=1 Tax=Pseudoroseicyclus aestuarii TaxID=1795041 RepID=A0A318T6S5_9RHOB|nr:aminodeoxychorismate synthase component I [Pseudoroseicyclus aestuarii]PYE84108.1 aminodeoxychorismate synthase subunit I [Pseudoroseicyclus aestuarii]